MLLPTESTQGVTQEVGRSSCVNDEEDLSVFNTFEGYSELNMINVRVQSQ